MHAPRQQPIAPPPPRRKVVLAAVASRAVAEPMRRRAFGLPEVREIPRRPAGGPWEAGW
jgi:hypothetical protein